MQMLGLILFVLFGGVTAIALLSVLNLILPSASEKAKSLLEASLGRAFLIGLVNFLFFMALALLLFQADNWVGGRIIGSILGGLGVLIALALTIFVLAGLTGFTRLIGERIGAAKTPFHADLRGGLALVLAGLTPFVGWYIFTPFVAITSLGAAILALFQKKPKVAAE